MVDIEEELVRRLVAEQFPRWAHLPVAAVARQGWDNRTFRLGEHLVVRLPSAEGYVPGVAKEDRYLPVLARHLPLPVPEPVATGAPGAGYPYPWSVRRWLPGDTLAAAAEVDRPAVARDLGAFLTALRSAPTTGGPAAGRHSCFRGCHPSAYGDEVEQALQVLGGRVDTAACREVWARALTSAWPVAPVWFHGDVAAGNLLVAQGRLSAVIDFGTCGVGDPACDLVAAWTWFAGAERRVFRESAGLPDDTWRRARGWALWKALITLATDDGDEEQWRALAAVLVDPVVD
ncbi:aminoglycoside phosphotransferase family protein [Micromonospora chersina]|uniref:Predicted kinase, aminoglycoside phosphotransferase (APT) family n=1 Tax=Micromonospora chersina TaxID=47854 RepID=A0A1C6U4Q9_9ACTN|nr:aminoglycoside phosphotransferase family protein [Micromonospora chersina]SCL49050.1 Predicted kinase, aminoglycoside phosphotransferase (APT) family [Micromonospora chersina]